MMFKKSHARVPILSVSRLRDKTLCKHRGPSGRGGGSNEDGGPEPGYHNKLPGSASAMSASSAAKEKGGSLKQ